MRTIVVPPAPGVFSAYGLLSGDLERHYSRSFSRLLDASILDELNLLSAALERETAQSMKVWAGSEASTTHALELDWTLDLQYSGQGSSLSIPLTERVVAQSALAGLVEDFEAEHARTFGHSLPGQPVRATALRLVARVAVNKGGAEATFPHSREPMTGLTRQAYWGPKDRLIETPVLPLSGLTGKIEGPALIDCYDTSIVVPPRATVASGPGGSVVIELDEA